MQISKIKIMYDEKEINLRHLYELAMNDETENIDEKTIDEVKRLNEIYLISVDILKNISYLIVNKRYKENKLTKEQAQKYSNINKQVYTYFYID